MKVYSQLEKASLEQLTSDPTGVATGYVYYNTSTSNFRYYDGSTWRSIVNLDGTQTLTNKTMNGSIVSDYKEFAETTAPATPASGKRRLYAKSDGIYQKTSAGVESLLSGVTKVVASYSGTNAPALSGTALQIQFTTQDVDTHTIASGTNTTWKLTVPITGQYMAGMTIWTAPTATANNQQTTIGIYVNNSIRVQHLQYTANAIVVSTNSVTRLLTLTAGDEVTFKAQSDAGASRSITTETYRNFCFLRGII